VYIYYAGKLHHQPQASTIDVLVLSMHENPINSKLTLENAANLPPAEFTVGRVDPLAVARIKHGNGQLSQREKGLREYLQRAVCDAMNMQMRRRCARIYPDARVKSSTRVISAIIIISS
jgi:hypothetical protein